jgi:hypothetical protein
LAPPPTFLPADVHALFVRAFTDGATDAAARPTADEWQRTLSRVEVTRCPRDQHEIPVGCTACPWCATDAVRSARRSALAAPVPPQLIHQVGGTPPKTRTRRRAPIYLGVGAVVILVLALASALFLQSRSGVATATVSQLQLNDLLLSPSQLDAAVGTSGIVPDHTNSIMQHDDSVVDEVCGPLNGVALAGPYTGSGWTALRDQVLHDSGQAGVSFTHRVDQGVVMFPSPREAEAFFSSSAQSWPACSNRSYATRTPGGADQQWTVGPVSNTNGILSYHNTTPGDGHAAFTTCQRALTAASNVVVDVQICSTEPSDSDSDAAADVARQIAAGVPTS